MHKLFETNELALHKLKNLKFEASRDNRMIMNWDFYFLVIFFESRLLFLPKGATRPTHLWHFPQLACKLSVAWCKHCAFKRCQGGTECSAWMAHWSETNCHFKEQSLLFVTKMWRNPVFTMLWFQVGGAEKSLLPRRTSVALIFPAVLAELTCNNQSAPLGLFWDSPSQQNLQKHKLMY